MLLLHMHNEQNKKPSSKQSQLLRKYKVSDEWDEESHMQNTDVTMCTMGRKNVD
jgi:hypothetical protein